MNRLRITKFALILMMFVTLACQIISHVKPVEPTLPAGVQISGTWWFEDNRTDGYLITNGVIRNDTSSPAWGVIRIEYLDADNEPIAVYKGGESALYDRDVSMIPIPAGGTGYFQRTCPLSIIHGKVADVSTSWESVELLETAPRIEISQFTWDRSPGGLTLTGEIKNAGDEPCPNPELWAVFNQGNQVTGINTNNWFDIESLAAGQEVPFNFLVYTIPDRFDDITPAINCPRQ